MKIINIILLCLLIIITGCETEMSPKQADYFIKYYGDYLMDYAGKVRPANDGGYIIIGTSQREDMQTDIVVIKTDEYGNQASWSPKYFGGDGNDYGRDLIEVDDGYILVGSTSNALNKDLNSYIVHIDDQGSIIWENTLGRVYDDEAMTIVQKENGGFIFAGYSTNSLNQKRVYIQPLDASGTPLPSSERGAQNEQILKIIKENNITYLAIGTRLENDQQFLVLKINDVGNDFANRSYGITGRHEVMSDAVFSPDETALFIVGTSFDINNENGEIYLTRINTDNLSEEWSKRISVSGSYAGKAIAFMGDDKLIIAGERQIRENKNIIIYIVDLEGNILQNYEYGGSGNQTAEDVFFFNDQIVVLGNNLYDGNSMITLMKIDEDGNLWN